MSTLDPTEANKARAAGLQYSKKMAIFAKNHIAYV